MKKQIEELCTWLDSNRPRTAPHTYHEGSKYFKILSEHKTVYAFIPKFHFETKTLGKLIRGGIYKPAAFNLPARHARGSVLQDSSWEECFDELGVKYLR